MRLLRNALLGLLLGAVLATPAWAATEAPDFRNVRWGMTMDEVRALETEVDLLDVSTRGSLSLGGAPVMVAGEEAIVLYYFDVLGRLESAGYVFTANHSSDNRYINDFERVKTALTVKYGEPHTDGAVWYQSTYRDDRDRWGLALSLGHVTFGAAWDTTTTRITLMLRGDNFEVTHGLVYTPLDDASPASAAPDTTGL